MLTAPSNRSSSVFSVDIDSVDTITAPSFEKEYIAKNRPLLMHRMTDDWPAMYKWSFEFFRQRATNAEVHIETGNVLQGETDFRKQSFRDFMERLDCDHGDTDAGYLSVFKIFNDFPDLKHDVDFSLLDQFKWKSSTVGWIGPAGTVTGYHVDWGDNLLAQVAGRKRVRLAPPESTPNMYVSKKFDQGTTISQVQLDNYDLSEFPLFAKVQQSEVILHPGDMLFIPRGWWHDVRSLDKSISVSNLTYDLRGIVCDALPQRVRQILHNAGIWKCDCTCHVTRDGKWIRK